MAVSAVNAGSCRGRANNFRGPPVTLFTACGRDGTVEAVNIRIASDGEKTAAELR